MITYRFLLAFWLATAAALSGATARAESPLDAGFSRPCSGPMDCGCNERCEIVSGLSGRCIALPVPDRCTNDSECIPCTGRVCERGRCLTPARTPVDCASERCTAPCAVCVNRVGCTFNSGLTCDVDSDCGPGAVCEGTPTRRCQQRPVPMSCASNADCATCARAVSCARGECVPTPEQTECTAGSCAGCGVCVVGVGCLRADLLRCANDAECGPAATCDRGRCATRFVTSCTFDSDCIPCTGRVCRAGACRFPSDLPPEPDAGLDAQSPRDAGLDASPRRDAGLDARLGPMDAAADGGSARRDFACSVRAPARGPSRPSALAICAGLAIVMVTRQRSARATKR